MSWNRKPAKLWGVFGWSEIGLGYFAANVSLLLFLPHTVSLLALINIMALPYSFWSVWYQKVKARQWCPLCLIVQVLLWGIFILNIIFDFIRLPVFDWVCIKEVLFVGCVFTGSILGFNLLIPKLSRGNGIEQVRQEINSLKANETIFKTLLTQQEQYEVSHTDSQILFGNPDASLQITILTNPFCNPCAKMHKRVEQLLLDTNGSVCVQYIFSAFNADLAFASKYLIAVYLEKGSTVAMQALNEWFEKGKQLKEAFFENMQLDMANPEIETEFQKHNAWKEKTQIRATPTILVNGYKLPDNYKIEDLRYFVDI